MLSKFDDYPIHQTPEPVAHPATGDRDFYERYWFNGYSRSGDFFFAVGAARYPHLGIQDCAISVAHNGVQHSFHASARAGTEPTDLGIGPFELEILQPMFACRVTLEANETDFSCDLYFEARTANVEEPRHHLGRGIRKTMDTTRFTQFGYWTGWIEFAGTRVELNRDATWGTKDRSWGTRPLAGGDQRGAPRSSEGGGVFFLWAPLQFDNECLHYQLFDDPRGRPLFQVGTRLPTYSSRDDVPGIEDPDAEPMRNLTHTLRFRPGNRMVESADVSMSTIDRSRVLEVHLEPLLAFRMKGIGYHHPHWGHGRWHGELAMASESWSLADIDETAFENQHVQHLVKATFATDKGEQVGLGVLEQLILGPYDPYALEGAW